MNIYYYCGVIFFFGGGGKDVFKIYKNIWLIVCFKDKIVRFRYRGKFFVILVLGVGRRKVDFLECRS